MCLAMSNLDNYRFDEHLRQHHIELGNDVLIVFMSSREAKISSELVRSSAMILVWPSTTISPETEALLDDVAGGGR